MGGRRLLHLTSSLALAACASTATGDESPSPAHPKKLDLAVPEISRYVTASELATPIPENLEEIIVNGQRPEPLPEHRPLPQGALGSLIYATTHPLDAWRILVPDPNLVIPDRTEDDPKDPPGRFRAQILDPGQIYD